MIGPKLVVFDSGLGGLTVLTAIHKALPGATFFYVADDAGFPYGDLAEDVLVERCRTIMAQVIPAWRPDAVVIACNTASTLALPVLRARFRLPFVGTVPAIKPAAEQTESGVVSVLATPGTVNRDYTRDLIRDYAAHVHVRLVGSARLAALAEAIAGGETVSDDDILAEIGPAFIEIEGKRTDQVVLGCTHYPLIVDRLSAVAPWPVGWIDPAPAIARRVATVVDGFAAAAVGPGQTRPAAGAAPALTAFFTSGRRPDARFMDILKALGIRHLAG